MSILYIDLDDTTVEFLEGVRHIHNSSLPPEQHVLPEELNCWHRNGDFIKPHLHTEGLFLNLAIKENAIDVLKELNERHIIKILTAFPTAQSAKEKVEFVEKHLPFLGLNSMILTWNKGLLNGDLLFDDSPVFIKEFQGLKVLFDRPYNKEVDSTVRVKSWEEFYKSIKVFENQGLLK